jgi:myo-inositol-1(or 4)-monophosphatase
VSNLNSSDFKKYSSFVDSLAKKLTKFYYSKLSGTFKVSNKLRGRGYDPVTTSDKAFEKFIRKEIKKRFPDHQVIGEEFGYKKTKSHFTWVIDPIDGTRSYVIGNPTWSNLISLNHKGVPVIGLANYPVLKKYYFNSSEKAAYVVDQGKKRKIKVNKKVLFKDIKMSAGFHGMLSLNKQKKIPKILKLMQFPCADALSYSHLAEGKVDAVLQCGNKIWDIHPLIPIIKAAGGVVSTWKNTDAVKAGNIVASANNNVQSKILKILKPITK